MPESQGMESKTLITSVGMGKNISNALVEMEANENATSSYFPPRAS